MATDEEPEYSRFERKFEIKDQVFPFQECKDLHIIVNTNQAVVVDLTDSELAGLRDEITRYLEAG